MFKGSHLYDNRLEVYDTMNRQNLNFHLTELCNPIDSISYLYLSLQFCNHCGGSIKILCLKTSLPNNVYQYLRILTQEISRGPNSKNKSIFI